MRIIFEIPKDYDDAICKIKATCGESCVVEEKNGLSGDTIISIAVLITKIVWDLVDIYLQDRRVNVQIELDDKTTTTISSYSVERAKRKADIYRKDWEKNYKV